MSLILRRIVHNDAMKEDPPEIYGWRVFMLACAACFGGMLFGIDSGAIGGILTLPPFETKYGLDKLDKVAKANLSANIVSTLQAGCFAGALIAGPVADWKGRRISLMTAAVVGAIGVVFQASSDGHLAPLYIGRFIAGLGTGAASMLTPLYVSECAPRAIRGALTGMYQLFNTTGIMLAFWINYGASLHLHGDTMWVVPMSLQAFPAVFLFFGMLLCKETPRFLAKQDRWEDSQAVLSVLRNLPRDHPYVVSEFTDMASQLERERQLVGGSSFWSLQKEMWTIPANRKRTIMAIVLMIGQQMTGTNAINYYAPTIFKALGVVGTSTNLFATGVYGIVKVSACSVFLLLAADSLGRRRSLIWTGIAQSCAMFYIGLYVRIKPPVSGEPVPPAGYVALVCIFLFAAFFQFGWGPVCWIVVSEIPTMRLRSLTVSYGAATQWLFNFVVARAVPNMLVTVGRAGYGTYLIFGSFCAIMALGAWIWVPETKGVALEDMDELFGIKEVDGKVIIESSALHHGRSTNEETKRGTHEHVENSERV